MFTLYVIEKKITSMTFWSEIRTYSGRDCDEIPAFGRKRGGIYNFASNVEFQQVYTGGVLYITPVKVRRNNKKTEILDLYFYKRQIQRRAFVSLSLKRFIEAEFEIM